MYVCVRKKHGDGCGYEEDKCLKKQVLTTHYNKRTRYMGKIVQCFARITIVSQNMHMKYQNLYSLF